MLNIATAKISSMLTKDDMQEPTKVEEIFLLLWQPLVTRPQTQSSQNSVSPLLRERTQVLDYLPR